MPEEFRMPGAQQPRVTLTVDDFDTAAAFHRDAPGLRQLAEWSSASAPRRRRRSIG